MKILIVVDMQNDFITGVLGTPEAQAIVPKVKEKINSFTDKKGRIFYTQDTHGESKDRSWIESQRIPDHCHIATPGWCIADDIYPFMYNVKYNIKVLSKTTFGYPNWGKILGNHKLLEDGIEIIGLCTDVCVISNALVLRMLYPEIPITVDASCCAGTTPEKHKAALDVMESCCINVINR